MQQSGRFMQRVYTPSPAMQTPERETTRREFLITSAALLAGGCRTQAIESQTASTKRNTEKIFQSEALSPPSIESSDPLLLARDQYPLQDYVRKTDTIDANSGEKLAGKAWFHEDPEGWSIDWNAERGPLKGIVVHHLGDETLEQLALSDPSVLARRISDTYKQSAYAPRYFSDNADPYVKGLPIHSGNVVRKAGEQDFSETFIPYHHLILPDGEVTTELSPLLRVEKGIPKLHMVGWHAGNWQVNCTHLGVCLAGNYVTHAPSPEQLASLQRLIAHYQLENPELSVHPHSQFRASECPGQDWWRAWSTEYLSDQNLPNFSPAQ